MAEAAAAEETGAGESLLSCRIITPDAVVYEGRVESVVLPGEDGKFGVLFNHTPYMAVLATGPIRLEEPDDTVLMACSGGFAEVSDNRVRILVETAELSAEIDVERARKAIERARKRLEKRHEEDVDVPRARRALQRARVRLQVAEQ